MGRAVAGSGGGLGRRLRAARPRAGGGARKAAVVGTALAVAFGGWSGVQLVNADRARAVTPPVGFTADDLPTWQTNGVVWAMAQQDGVVFAGGTFSAIRPPGAEAGSSERAAVNFAAFDAATGAPTDCKLSFTVGSGGATVRALEVSPDGRTLYAGGKFGSVNGTPVSNVAAVDIASCTVKSGFKVSVSATVRTLDVTADTVYLGGDFLTVAGQSRSRFAAVSTGGALRAWNPNADKVARALEVTPDGRHVVLGGDFDTVGGKSSHALAVVDSSAGAVKKAYGSTFIHRASVIKGMTMDDDTVYTAHEGNGTGVFDGRIALGLDDFEQRWRDTCLGATQDLAVHDSVLYSVSHAHNCSSMGQFPELRERQHLLAESTDNPKPLLSWFPDTDDGPSGTEQIGPRAMVASRSGDTDYMWVGGEFTRIVTHGNMKQQGLVRFADGPDTGAPSVPDEVTAANASGGDVKLSWQAALDEDDSRLTYRVYRNGSTTPVGTVTADSVFWKRPTVTFTDKDADSGTAYSYRVTASDAGDANTSARSTAATVTTPGTPKQTTVTREATADAYVNGASTGTNYGTHQQLAVRGTAAYETYARFSLPAAPSGMKLTKAQLGVTTSNDPNAASADSHRVRLVTGGWTEAGVTYATRPSLDGTTLGTLAGAAQANTEQAVTLDPAALTPKLGGTLDLALTGTGTDSLWLWSKDRSAASGPRLTLTFEVP
ncbi:DNRLRE domain-containing protein [Streptomyces sp. Z26]|uniref:CBM96 family carbohydrate-binding protein n=1 Tax=Streptomyces TaxID=1883 RepID=UPI000EF13F78|nr:DNRLRE domain-containing protein [Streptomyces sp. Z26]RLL70222.1 fibronectin type III domain-containing protein [Streptomyces sp. Z26]